MSFFSRYVAYLKDNPEGYWFKRKVFGWGWFPATWQGWLALGIFVALLAWLIVPFASELAPSNSDTTWFLIKVLAWAAVLVLTCYLTGEPPKWQWGFPEKEEGIR